MLKINFYPDSDDVNLSIALKVYQQIWDEDGERIIKKIEEISKINFSENIINSIVYFGLSSSHPLSLRANFPDDMKKANLIHELCHRLLQGNNQPRHSRSSEEQNLESHKNIFLIFYDILEELYGKEYANKQVELESTFRETYKIAWDWVLKLTKEERKNLFMEKFVNSK